MFKIPKAYCTSLQDLTTRHQYIESEFNKYSCDYKLVFGYDGRKADLRTTGICSGKFINSLNSGEVGAVLTHLKTIKTWLEDTQEADSIGFFCEDDISLETLNYIRFTWEDFIHRLPKDWRAVQLALFRPNKVKENDFKFRPFSDNMWSVGTYMLSRSYANKLIEHHCNADGTFNLDLISSPEVIPYVENIIYGSIGIEDTYSIPLFTENINIPTSFYPDFSKTFSKVFGENNHTQNDDSLAIVNWWRSYGWSKSLEWFFEI